MQLLIYCAALFTPQVLGEVILIKLYWKGGRTEKKDLHLLSKQARIIGSLYFGNLLVL